jgi:hypothetical protein
MNIDNMPGRLTMACLAMLLSAGLAAAQATFTPISATASPLGPLDPGKVKCFDATPTRAWPPCGLGNKAQIRGRILMFHQVGDHGLTGNRTLEFNANFDENGRGHAWGTWHFVAEDGISEMEGTYTGSTTEYFGASDGQIVGHGTEGDLEGLELRAIYSYQVFPGGAETVSGNLLEPPRGH